MPGSELRRLRTPPDVDGVRALVARHVGLFLRTIGPRRMPGGFLAPSFIVVLKIYVHLLHYGSWTPAFSRVQRVRSLPHGGMICRLEQQNWAHDCAYLF